MILQAIAWLPAAGLALLLLLLELRVGRAPRLRALKAPPAAEPDRFLRLVIPATNEVDHIAACVTAVLASDEVMTAATATRRWAATPPSPMWWWKTSPWRGRSLA